MPTTFKELTLRGSPAIVAFQKLQPAEYACLKAEHHRRFASGADAVASSGHDFGEAVTPVVGATGTSRYGVNACAGASGTDSLAAVDS